MIKKNLILVDDDEVFGEVIQSMLMAENFDVTYLPDPQKLPEVIQTKKPAVIIMDYFLDRENGAIVTQQLKADVKTADIPVIMVSSNYGINQLAKKAGATAFLPKPFDIDKLVRLINQVIG